MSSAARAITAYHIDEEHRAQWRHGVKRICNDLAHIQPTKHKIRAALSLLPNTERSHSVLKN
jgi:hypothetical protein